MYSWNSAMHPPLLDKHKTQPHLDRPAPLCYFTLTRHLTPSITKTY